MDFKHLALSCSLLFALSACGPKQDSVSAGSAALPQEGRSDPESAVHSREIWAGENGHIMIEIRDLASNAVLGSIAVLAQDAGQQGVALAAEKKRHLTPGDERWSWGATAWPAGAMKMAPNLSMQEPTGSSVLVTHTLFPASSQALSAVPAGNHRIYSLSRSASGASPEAWIRVDLDAQGNTTAIHWYKAASVQQALLRIDDNRPMYMTPITAAELPSQAFVIDQTPR